MATRSQTIIHVEFGWQRLGQVRIDDGDRMQFPSAPRLPGLYRFRLCGAGDVRHYFGETDELRRRLQHYRTPGKSQQTNIRMNAAFREHMASGGDIRVDIVTEGVTVIAADQPVPVDLRHKALRRLLEHAAIVEADYSGSIMLNR